MEDENKNQNQDIDPISDNEDRNNSVPGWMTGSGNKEDDNDIDEESLGHESLTEDQEVDIDEFEEKEENPVASDDYGQDDEEDGEEEEEEEESNFYDDDEGEEEEEEEEDGDSVVISKSKILLIKKLLNNINDNAENLNRILGGYVSREDEANISISEKSEGFLDDEEGQEVSKIVEGVFDGENMIGPDGKQYSVPSNYASKSKLVEGDLLKLTITKKGTFVYKQIKPIERDRVIGYLEKAGDGTYTVFSEGKRWRVLVASVTYFKGESGDEVVILVPRVGDSKWAAVENIIKNK